MRILAPVIGLFFLYGCGAISTGVPGAAQIGVLTVVGTDKTIVDHFISATSGKDCSTVRLEKGDYYCAEDEPTVTQNLHCYKSLGSVTCYDQPNPHGESYQKIGQNDHNYVDKKPIQVR